MKELKIDRKVTELLPTLTDDETAKLEASIQKYGCRHPITIWKGKDIILDGHNRYKACQKFKIEFDVEELEFETKSEALLWMYDTQLGRRNLSDANRIEIALAREHLIGGNISTKKELSREARDEIAESAGVSNRTVSKVKVVQDEGTKKIKKDMHEGKISIDKAYKETRHIEDKPKEPSPPPTPEPVKPQGPPEGFRACHYCKGTGIEKIPDPKAPKVYTDGKRHCSCCGGTVFEGDKCKTCGLVN